MLCTLLKIQLSIENFIDNQFSKNKKCEISTIELALIFNVSPNKIENKACIVYKNVGEFFFQKKYTVSNEFKNLWTKPKGNICHKMYTEREKRCHYSSQEVTWLVFYFRRPVSLVYPLCRI